MNTTRAVRGYLSTAEVAARLQYFFDSNAIAIVCWTQADQDALDGILDRYNTIGRIVAGVDLNKYLLFFDPKVGDITVLAPPGMTPAEYDADVYPGAISMGAWFVPILIGAVILAGVWLVSKALETWATLKDEDTHQATIAADLKAAALPPDQRAAYAAFKAQSVKDRIAEANASHEAGWFDKLFGAGTGSTIGLALGAVVALFVLSSFGSARAASSPAPAPRENPYPGASCMSGARGGGWKGRVKWSDDAGKRTRQARHIADYYDGKSWGAYADYLHDTQGATEIEFSKPGTY